MAAWCGRTSSPPPHQVLLAGWKGLKSGSLLGPHLVERDRDLLGLPARLDLRRAARHPDGQLQGGRGLRRADHGLHALSAGLGDDPAPDPLDRDRHRAEDRGDLHRHLLPAADPDRRRLGAGLEGPDRRVLHARRLAPPGRHPRAVPGLPAGRHGQPPGHHGLGLDLPRDRRAGRRQLRASAT